MSSADGSSRPGLPFEFLYQVFALLIALIIVHSVYVTLIRPRAAAELDRQAVLSQQSETYVAERSIYVVLKDLEQEACLVLMLWAMAIMGYKGRAAWKERELLRYDLIQLPEGTRILPADAGGFARQLEAHPGVASGSLLPRILLAALRRFAATESIDNVSANTKALCEQEGDRLESELAMIRYIAWAIPSIGFIGTVRGIGQALSLAHQAMEGNISGVTSSLGVAFNSTFVALLLSLGLMFLVHQLQLLQERLVLDAQEYCDERLIRRMEVRSDPT